MKLHTKTSWGILFAHLVLSSADPVRPANFVNLKTVAPNIQQSMRYSTEENFMGRVVPGYENVHNGIVVTQAAAEGLKKAQDILAEQGYELVIYDGYRRAKATVLNSFVPWAQNLTDTSKQAEYYPEVPKTELFKQGYIAEKSGHSRGSTVDLTIIKKGKQVAPHVRKYAVTLADGRTVIYIDDNTVNMGTSFDLFDPASHSDSTLVSQEAQNNRRILRDAMLQAGFRGSTEEWWHFTLNNEPYPDTYFDFPLE